MAEQENNVMVTWSWSVSYITKEGYEATLTAWGDDAGAVLAGGKKVLAQMQKGGVTPVRTRPTPPAPHRVVER